MAKIFSVIFIALLIIALTKSTKADKTKEIREDGSQRDMSPSATREQASTGSDINMQELMNMCNESFRIEMEYLKSLNETGSFLDESDKTPKCFLRCMLENTGILMEDGQIDSTRAAVVFAGVRSGKPMDDLGEFTARCAMDRTEKCLCEKAYNFMRCLMSLEIDKYGMSQ